MPPLLILTLVRRSVYIKGKGPLLALAAIISAGARTLEDAYAQQGHTFPSLNESFRPGPLDGDMALADTTRLIVAAAHQIIATVRAPLDTFQDYAPAMYLTSSLGFVDQTDIADVLKEAPAGLHVNDIGKKINVEPVKIARVLRYLASRHVFREVAPNVFANNRLSSFLVKTFPFEELKSKPADKYEGSPAAAFVGHMSDEAFKSAEFLPSQLLNDTQGYETAFNQAYKTKQTLYYWYNAPDNQWCGSRFAALIKGAGDSYPPSIFINGMVSMALQTPCSVVVDVGGSLGGLTLVLAREFPHLRYVVQDLAPIIVDAGKFWADKAPELISSGQVTLQVQDFFQPQAVKEASVYCMRFILHNWPDSTCEKILRHLRAAAGPQSKLVVFDGLMPLACPDDSEGALPPPPFPLLANLGLPVGGLLTWLDLHMLATLNGQERTFSEFVELGARTGWKFEGVKQGKMAAIIFSAA
ncbi:S-adenosyl-L-methionine-dependent methyltransferase [Auriscalpium vulgare]|uniref:S-adenosyl-L-methionine-dependent methyltransferase n=1 Tax=Auriscalpium vulgare TaxID=40419 RepID=A0ACB8RI70_9AGAM|nr:S-adenosyl-L-methionine-dependent methyltransferase [Auriscalpium vulgare]